MIIEAKPSYSVDDREKLIDLFSTKMDRLVSSLKSFSINKPQFAGIDYDRATYIPVLAFGNPKLIPPCVDCGFGHIYIKSLNEARMVFFDVDDLEG